MSEETNRKDFGENIRESVEETIGESAVAMQSEVLPAAQVNAPRVCELCGNPEIVEGYAINLCQNCRDEATKINVPLWVKAFALMVTAIFLFALTKFPIALSAGISFEKGNMFEQEKRYMSAMKEYEKVVDLYPDSTDSLCKLFISQYKVGRIGPASETYEKLIGRDVDDDGLYEEVVKCFDQLDNFYYSTKEYNELFNSADSLSPEAVRDRIKEYVDKHPDEIYPKMDLAAVYTSGDEIEKGKDILINILKDNPEFVDCGFYLASIYRTEKEYAKALDIYNEMLESNAERADAISAIARIEIKRGNDGLGLDMALKAYELDNVDPFILANLILAYHYNNMSSERDKSFDLFKSQGNYNEADLTLLTGIIKGTDTEWRD